MLDFLISPPSPHLFYGANFHECKVPAENVAGRGMYGAAAVMFCILAPIEQLVIFIVVATEWGESVRIQKGC
jgi:hypothetical protein